MSTQTISIDLSYPVVPVSCVVAKQQIASHCKDSSRIEKANLAGLVTQVTEQAFVSLLSSFSQVEALNLSHWPLTDRHVELIVKHVPNLRELSLAGTKITDVALQHLSGLKQLAVLNVRKTKVTAEALKALTNIAQIIGTEEHAKTLPKRVRLYQKIPGIETGKVEQTIQKEAFKSFPPYVYLGMGTAMFQPVGAINTLMKETGVDQAIEGWISFRKEEHKTYVAGLRAIEKSFFRPEKMVPGSLVTYLRCLHARITGENGLPEFRKKDVSICRTYVVDNFNPNKIIHYFNSKGLCEDAKIYAQVHRLFQKALKENPNRPASALIEKGTLTERQIATMNKVMCLTVDPKQVEARVNQFAKQFLLMNQEGVHPLVLASYAHQEITKVHPFEDGNGRLARLFMNLVLMRARFHPVIFPVEKDYLELVQKSDSNRNQLISYLVQRIIQINYQIESNEGYEKMKE